MKIIVREEDKWVYSEGSSGCTWGLLKRIVEEFDKLVDDNTPIAYIDLPQGFENNISARINSDGLVVIT